MIHRAARIGRRLLCKVVCEVDVRVRVYRRARLEHQLKTLAIKQVNLCNGTQRVPGWFGIDVVPGSDLTLDLSRGNLPFANGSLRMIVCMSAINYFQRVRGVELVREMFRVLEPGGVCRVGVQDMRALAQRYIDRDMDFFFEKLPDGRDRLEGPTIGDKFAAWFYGYSTGSHRCEYFYDFESLAHLFNQAGFSIVERRQYRDSRIADVASLDNRPEQMVFLEAVK